MKRALAIAAALAFVALIAAAFLAIGPRGNPGPLLSPAPIGDLQRADITVELELAAGGGARQNVLFGRRATGIGPTEFAASIVILRESGAVEVPLDPDVFGGLAWVHAAQSGDRLTIWALADNAVESPGWELQLVVSTDGGLTWRHYSSVPKPYYFATFAGFRMSTSGIGAVSLSLDTEAPGEGAKPPPGLYVYRTGDGGLTWSGPEYFEDDTKDAWRTEQAPAGFADPN